MVHGFWPGSSQASRRCSRLRCAVAEGEAQDDIARGGGRFELDIGDAVVALDAPHRAGALEPGELAGLLGVGLDGGIIRGGEREIAGQAVMDRAAVADRSGAARCTGRVTPSATRRRLGANQIGAHGGVGEEDLAAQRLDDLAVGVDDLGRQHGHGRDRSGRRATG